MHAGGAARWVLALALTVGALWLVGRVWWLLWELSWPFLFGGLAALALERPVGYLERRAWPRPLATAACLALALALSLAGGTWLVAGVWRELRRLVRRLPATDALLATLRGALAPSGSLGWLPDGLRTVGIQELTRLQSGAGPLLQHGVLLVRHLALATPDALFGLFVAVAAAYCGCCHRAELRRGMARVAGRGQAGRLAGLVGVARDSVWGLIRAQCLLALATFAVSLLGLWLIGAPYVLVASLAAGVLDLLPVVGPGLVYGPWILGTLIGHMPGAAIALACVFLCVGVVRWLATPHLLGRGIGLHPFATLAAMYVGARLAGVGGLFLGPLVATVARAAWLPIPPAVPAGPGRRTLRS